MDTWGVGLPVAHDPHRSKKHGALAVSPENSLHLENSKAAQNGILQGSLEQLLVGWSGWSLWSLWPHDILLAALRTPSLEMVPTLHR